MATFSSRISAFVFSKWFFVLGFGLTFLLHAPFLNRPPESVHVWRQATTLAMTRNFYTEEMNPFKPRVDNRRGRDGVTGSQFPSYEFVVAGIYHLTGEQFWVHRMFSLFLYMLGAWGMYRLCMLLTMKELIGRAAFWGFLWSPELFYHAINALPDVLALTASIWGLFYFLRYLFSYSNLQTSLEERGMIPSPKSSFSNTARMDFTASFFLIALAGLTKLQFLAIGFPIVGFLIHFLRRILPVQYLKLSAFGAAVVGIPLLWYGYAVALIKKTGLADFGLEIRPVDNLQEGISILTGNLVSDLPELILNFANFGLLAIGLFFCFSQKKWRSLLFLPFLIWSLGLIAYHLIELSQMKHHSYYMMPYFPVLLPLAGYGAYRLAQANKWGILAVLLFIQPVLTSIRILPARWLNPDKRVPVELYEQESRDRLANAVPNNAPTVVGVDESNCIYFYYLNKKGFGVSYPKQLVNKKTKTKTFLDYYISEGAEYLYLDDPNLVAHPKIQTHIDKIILKEGRFSVIKLK